MATFVHTADWWLREPADVPGLKIPVQWGLELSDYELIRRVGEVAREHHADFVLAVGRIFSSPTPSRELIAGAIRAIAEIELPVILVPGGLDDGSSGSVWEDELFVREAARWAPNLRVLLSSEPIEQGGCLLCPVVARGSPASLLDGWTQVCERLAANRHLSRLPFPRIMILPNVAGADEQDSAMAAFLDDAVLAETDYVALAGGDRMREVTPKAWQSGNPGHDTSEPTVDESDRHETGHVAVVEVGLRGTPPHVAAAPTSWRTQEPMVAYGRGPEEPPPTDDNVQFTVFRPQVVAPAKWYDLVAAAHLDSARPEAAPDEPSPLDRVQAKARAILGDRIDEYAPLTHDALQGVPQGSELTFAFEMPGVEFNPARVSFGWWEDEHTVAVRLRAAAALDGTTARGRMTVFLGALILADVPFSLRVDAARATDRPRLEPEREAVRRYRRIFASYSHRDLPIVEQFEAFVEATGDRYLRDHKVLRAGEAWDDRLLELITEADVFQLFWSRNAMVSPHVRREWEHALSLGRDNFIRPVYWESPLPQAQGLPPEPLTRIHFQFLGGIDATAADPKTAAAEQAETMRLEREVRDLLCADNSRVSSSDDFESLSLGAEDGVFFDDVDDAGGNTDDSFSGAACEVENDEAAERHPDSGPTLGGWRGILVGFGIGIVVVPIVIWLIASLFSPS